MFAVTLRNLYQKGYLTRPPSAKVHDRLWIVGASRGFSVSQPVTLRGCRNVEGILTGLTSALNAYPANNGGGASEGAVSSSDDSGGRSA